MQLQWQRLASLHVVSVAVREWKSVQTRIDYQKVLLALLVYLPHSSKQETCDRVLSKPLHDLRTTVLNGTHTSSPITANNVRSRVLIVFAMVHGCPWET